VAGTDGEESLGAADLLTRADIAVQGAKAAGRDRVVVAEAELLEAESRARDSLSWAGVLRDALETGGLDLHAQPIVALSGGGAPRYELLVRLRERPDIGSRDIITTAERFGQIQAVDGWVCARALDMLTQTADTVLHVNLAAASLGDPDLMVFLERAVRAADLAPGRLVFEVTETAAIADLDSALITFERLRALGCHLALDDFGSGFASFAYLKRFPFDILKIDGEFVRELPDSLVDRLTVEAMTGIARGLGMAVVAEYVSNDGTLAVLRELGIQYAQGFHCGAPAPAQRVLAADDF
jgi:EAL domain-containing protein (putative c-di-GMP-specific phosphodiesterase class I)